MGDRAVAIVGASGSGKSSLALQLIGLGAKLIADDQTRIELHGSEVWASKPGTLPSKIEARGVGLLDAPMSDAKPLMLIIDLDTVEQDRFPDQHDTTLLKQKITVLRKVSEAHFPAAILVYLSHMPEHTRKNF